MGAPEKKKSQKRTEVYFFIEARSARRIEFINPIGLSLEKALQFVPPPEVKWNSFNYNGLKCFEISVSTFLPVLGHRVVCILRSYRIFVF